MGTFEDVVASTAGIPNMTPAQGRRVFDHIRETGARDILEIGTAHGVSASYMAAAVQGVGKVTTVDHAVSIRSRDPSPSSVIARSGLSDTVQMVLVEDSSYTWWLKDQIRMNSDEWGNCTPIYDFCYLDGAHNFTIDGLAVVLIEKLLRPGGWLLMDDLQWYYTEDSAGPRQGIRDLMLSKAEISEPHMQFVFDLIVRTHPSFTTTKVENRDWGWAKKDPGAPVRSEVVATTMSIRTRLILALRKIRTRLRSGKA